MNIYNFSFIIASLLMAVLLFMLAIAMSEGMSRSTRYLFRWLEAKWFFLVFRIRSRFGITTIWKFIAGILKISAGAIILFYPYINKQVEADTMGKIAGFFKSGWVLPFSLIYLWIFKFFHFENTKGLPLTKKERKRLLTTSKSIDKIKLNCEFNPQASLDTIQKSLLTDITLKTRMLIGEIEDLEINASLLIPADKKMQKLKVLNRSNDRETGIVYETKLLAANSALINNACTIFHKLEHFTDELPEDLRAKFGTKPYKTVLAIPIRLNFQEPVYVGVLSIDADFPYYFHSKGTDLEIALKPYASILALTIPTDSFSVPIAKANKFLQN